MLVPVLAAVVIAAPIVIAVRRRNRGHDPVLEDSHEFKTEVELLRDRPRLLETSDPESE